ncbi:hypothetical protein O4H52_03230 [Sphingomonadaceae bacterium G21617-S1]|nr:hypothetical protein [Sphingomonadaceae bacterium G21617-S1]
MSIRAIHAIFECDGCGCEFGADIEVAGTRPLRWSMIDIANEALRHGSGWVRHQREKTVGPVSYQRGKHLCPNCTRDEDDRHQTACADPECDGCKLAVESANDDISDRAYGRAVAAHVVEKAGLRRAGESVAEYALRAGIPLKQTLPSKPASFDDYLGDAS